MISTPHSSSQSAPHSSPLPTFPIPAAASHLPPFRLVSTSLLCPQPWCFFTSVPWTPTAASTWWGIGKCLWREWNAVSAKLILASGSPVQSAIKHPWVWKACPPFQYVLSLRRFMHVAVFYRLLVTGQVDETDMVTAETGALPGWSFQPSVLEQHAEEQINDDMSL